jgi:ABC-2 type transport system permease protein
MIRAAYRALRRDLSIYTSFFGMMPKVFMAYQLWFWIGLVLNTIAMAILYFFWRAVYGDADSIAALSLTQTLTYILLAQVFRPLTEIDLIWEFGYGLREGQIMHYLLRPINFQGMYYAQSLGSLASQLVLQIPIAIAATLLFGLQWPTTLAAWGAFIVSALLGFTILFFFHWFLACLTFYTTEVWGLGMLIHGMTLFLSGALVPLAMMPTWLERVLLSIPFAQALAVPINLLTGITPLNEAPYVWFTQLIWIFSMWLFSTVFFRIAVRKITVQGG